MLAIIDGGDNSLCFQAPGSDSFAGLSAPLKRTTFVRMQSISTLLPLAPIFMTRCDRNGHGRLLSTKLRWILDEKTQVGDDQSLLRTGVVDSTGILELIEFLEVTFNVKFSDDELVADNFDSVSKMISFMTKKMS